MDIHIQEPNVTSREVVFFFFLNFILFFLLTEQQNTDYIHTCNTSKEVYSIHI